MALLRPDNQYSSFCKIIVHVTDKNIVFTAIYFANLLQKSFPCSIIDFNDKNRNLLKYDMKMKIPELSSCPAIAQTENLHILLVTTQSSGV